MKKKPKKAIGAPAILPAKQRTVPFSDLNERQREAFATPSGFARLYLGLQLYPEQERILDAFGPSGSAVSVRTCNEYGKTTRVIAPLILWHASLFPQDGPTGGCISTSGSWPQVTAQLVPALKRFQHKFRSLGWEFLHNEIKCGSQVKWLGFSTNDAGKAEGFHGTPQFPLLATVDEAKTVGDEIISMIETRCRPQRFGLLSSPGYAELEFYRSQTVNAALYRSFAVPAARRPPPGVTSLHEFMIVKHLNYQVLDRIVMKHGGGDWARGLKSPMVCSAIFAEFMEFVEDAVMSLADVEAALALPPKPRPGERHGWCDFAAGGDENVFALRVGNRAMLRDAWVDKDTMSAVGRFVRLFVEARDEYGLRAEEIDGDADGLGAVMIDALRDSGWDIGRRHNNATPRDKSRYKNAVSEQWYEGADMLRHKSIILPDDNDLKCQLTNRKMRYDKDGLLWLEGKDQMKLRNVPSPDRADAILGCMSPLLARGSFSAGTGEQQTQSNNPWADDYAPADADRSVPEELVRGFDAGG